MSDRQTGSCLCGAASFEIDGTFDGFYLCHCERCRKDTGSAHAANLFSSTATLTWLSGEEKATLYNLPSSRHRRCFCSTCGSALPYVVGSRLVVPAGSLGPDFKRTPDAHIFVASKAKWEDALDSVPKFDTFPA